VRQGSAKKVQKRDLRGKESLEKNRPKNLGPRRTVEGKKKGQEEGKSHLFAQNQNSKRGEKLGKEKKKEKKL